MINLAKAAFRGARAALEDLGIVPDRLEREQLARLTLSLGDLEVFSAPPLGLPTEWMNPIALGTAARFSAVYFVSPVGFWWRSVNINPATVATSPVGILHYAGIPPAVANSFGVVRSSPTGVASRVVVTGGDTVAGVSFAYKIPSTTINLDALWSWVAPGITLAFHQTLVFTPIDMNIVVTTPLER